MATVVAGSIDPLRMDQLDIGRLYYEGNSTSKGPTFMNVDIGGGYMERLTGFGVTYNINNAPLSGTITGYQETYQGQNNFNVTDFNVDATTFYNWVVDRDTNGALSTILSGNDQITGSPFSDYVRGYAGHDYIAGGNGADTIDGGLGNDHIYGQSANGGADGADRLDGGDGDDYVQGNAGNDTISGGNGNDRLVGGADNDNISGGEGDDQVNGNLGSDTIDGGAGNDYLRGGQGDDSIVGGAGNDQLLGDLGNDTISGGSGLDIMTGGAGNDVFKFGSSDASFSTSGDFANFTDVITDFVHGTDKLSLAFMPTTVMTGTATSFSAAVVAAQNLLNGHAGFQEVAAVQVGNDTYLFWNSSGSSDQANSAVDLQGVTASQIGTSDFV